MPNKMQIPLIKILLLCLAAGLAVAFGYEPIYYIASNFFQKQINASPWQEIAASSATGIIYLGIVIFFIVILALTIITRNIFRHLVTELRYKELLPPSFDMAKKRGLSETYREIINIFDLFMRSFVLVKQDKDKFAKTIETYLDPSLTQQIHDRKLSELYLGGRKKTATVFFSDLRGFTTLTENTDPNKVVTILNEYISMATKIIDKNKGKVNKFIGDAILAVFEEAPKYADYVESDKAVIAALDIQREFKNLMKKWLTEIDPLLNLGLGIGIARGEIIAGNIGSEARMEYTVIGDTVNFASRLCSIAKDGEIIISDYVFKLLEKVLDVEVLPETSVKGKSGMYEIYSVKNRKMIV